VNLKARIAVAVVAMSAGAVGTSVGRFVVYRGLIIPRLPGWVEVPLGWWALAFASFIVAIVMATIWRREKWFLIGAFASLGSIAVLFFADVHYGMG